MLHQKSPFLIPVLLIVLLSAMFIAVSLGPVNISFSDCVQMILYGLGLNSETSISSTDLLIFWQLRLPRVIMAVLSGAALAVAGTVFQSVFRNPICDPYVLGISSGASLGAALAFVFGWEMFWLGVTIPALCTALCTLILMLGLTYSRKVNSNYSLLLVGVAVNFFISAIITLLMVQKQESMQKILYWTMGSLATSGWNEVLMVFLFSVVGMGILLYYSKDLNLLQMGETTARSLGVNVRWVTRFTLVVASVITAVVVSVCGVIGFVGLVVPHMARLLVGANQRKVLVCSVFCGAVFLLIADTLARTIVLPSELPVGSITALVGGPFFVFLLLKKNKVS
ncbi:MAG: iron ABC transporter permease [Bacteroidales bacterium]|nr:iron ABC transporter permease [Bacteroidales bacterium]